MVVCPRCRKVNPEGQAFCVRCGAPLQAEGEGEASSAPSTERPPVPDGVSEEWVTANAGPAPTTSQAAQGSGRGPTSEAPSGWEPMDQEPPADSWVAVASSPSVGPGTIQVEESPFDEEVDPPAKEVAPEQRRRRRRIVGITVAVTLACCLAPLVVFQVMRMADSDGAGSGGPTSSYSSSGKVEGSASEGALGRAKSHLESGSYSHDGLVDELVSDGYSQDEAAQAVDACGADWNDQAVAMAQEYLDAMPMSHDELVDQLEYEKFTSDQAAYGADHCDANWDDQASRMAKELLEDGRYTRQELVQRLVNDGFTQEQAEHGVSAAP